MDIKILVPNLQFSLQLLSSMQINRRPLNLDQRFLGGDVPFSPLFYNRVTIKSLPLIPACKFNLFSIVCVLKINTEFWRV